MAKLILHRRTDLHIARKLWHVTMILIVALVYSQVDHSIAVPLMVLASAPFIVLDVLRQYSKAANEFVTKMFGPIMREGERNSFAGTTYMTVGTIFVMIVFPKEIVLLSLIMLAIADPLASYIGILYGKDKILRNKSLQGSLAAFAACTLLGLMYFYSLNLMTDRLLIVAPLSGLIGALSELIPIGKLDDNLTFPILCCAGHYGLFMVFGGL